MRIGQERAIAVGWDHPMVSGLSRHEYAAAVWPGMFDFPFPGAGWGDAIGLAMRRPGQGLLRRPLIFAPHGPA